MTSTIREFFRGVGLYLRGFKIWASDPGVMLLGAIPALIVGLFFLTAVIALAFAAPGIAEWATPFADPWDEVWRTGLRIVVAVAIVAAAVAIGVMTFAAVTLAVASPFTDRISRVTEQRMGNAPEPIDEPVWRAIRRGVGDGLVLVGTGLVNGVLAFLLGLIPVIGGVLGWTTGALLGGRALAIELTGTPGDARDMPIGERQRLLASRRALTLGFGVCAYLTFLIPGGAVIGTPALTAGGTLLLRELVGEPTTVTDARVARPAHPTGHSTGPDAGG
ncbi:MAG: EI24 domain-containing protein [Pseudoclavibacter sp.]